MVVIRKKDAAMTIPAALVGLEDMDVLFTDVGVSSDFEDFLDNVGFRYLTAYPFKNLGKAQTEKMNQARKTMPLFVDISKDDFDDVLGEGSWRKYNFTDNKMQKQLGAFKKKLKGESVYHLITMLQTKEFLGKELVISDTTLKRMSAKEINLTMDELDNESKIQKVVGYEAGKGLHSSGTVKDVGSSKADKGIEFTPDKDASRTISLLGKFDKGQPIIDLGRNSPTFDMFMDNIDIEKKKIIIDTENYIKNVMSIHGFYDEKTKEWQIDMSDAPSRKTSHGTKGWQEILDKIHDASEDISDGFGDDETEVRSHYVMYENHKVNLKDMKDNGFLKEGDYKQELQNLEDAYAELKEANENLGGMFDEGAETGEADMEEVEGAKDIEVVEAEGNEVGKALMKAERLLKAKGQTKEIPRVSDRSVEYVTLQGEVDAEDKFKPGAMEFSNVKFELKDYTGKTQRLSSPRELWNSRKTELTTGDIREALLSGDEQNALKAVILDTITPSNGEITIGKTEITWNVPNWEDNEAGYEEFLLRLQRKGADEESEYQSFKPEAMKIATMLKVYSEIIKNSPDLDVKKILQSYENEEELLQEMANFMWQIKTDIQDLKEGVGWTEERDNPAYAEPLASHKKQTDAGLVYDSAKDKYVEPKIDMETGKVKSKDKDIPNFYTKESRDAVAEYRKKKKELSQKLRQEHASKTKEGEIGRELDKNILQQKVVEKLGKEPELVKIPPQLSDVPTKIPPHKRYISTAKDWKLFTEKYDDNTEEGLQKLYDDLNFFHKATESWTVKIPKKETSSAESATMKLIGGAKKAIELNLFYRPKGEVALDFDLPELYEHMRRNKEHTNVMDDLNYTNGDISGLLVITEYDDYFKGIIEFGGGQVEEQDTLIQPQVNLLWLGKPVDKDKNAIHRRQLVRTKHEVKATRKKWRSSSKKKIHDKDKAQDVNALMKIKNNYNQLQRVIG